jgi:hypothetical protein
MPNDLSVAHAGTHVKSRTAGITLQREGEKISFTLWFLTDYLFCGFFEYMKVNPRF